MSDSSHQAKKMTAVKTPELDTVLKGFGRKTIRTLFGELDPGLPREQVIRYEEELIEAAELWQRLVLLDAAARAASAVVKLEGEECAAHMNRASGMKEEFTTPAQQAYILARMLLNEPDFILDDASPFDPTAELGLWHMTRALVGQCRLRTTWAWKTLDEERAKKLVKASELSHGAWRGRIARLAKEYEKEKYPGKAVSGSSST